MNMKILILLFLFNCSQESFTYQILNKAHENIEKEKKCKTFKSLVMIATKGEPIQVDGMSIYPHQYNCEKQVKGEKQGNKMGQ